MIKTVIHAVIGIKDCILIVFHTDVSCWQFRVIYDGGIYGEKTIYYTPEAAMDAAREWVYCR